MKRILNIISQRPEKTGSGIYLQELVKEADEKCYEQAVVAGIPLNYEGICFSTKNDVKFYPVIFETEELPFSVVGMSDVMPYKSVRYRDLTMDMLERWKNCFAKTIYEAVTKFKPDIIICHHLWILTALVKEMYPNQNIIAFCHGTDLRQLNQFRSISDNISKEVVKYVTENCKNVETIIVSHNSEKELVEKQYCIDKEHIKIAGTGFNPDIFYMDKNKSDYEKIKIVYAGKLSYSKGLLSLIGSIKMLSNTYENLELYLAGSGDGQEALNIINTCKNCFCGDNIHILGSIPQVELAQLFRTCNVFVLPSFYEGLPLVPIEAMACGLKVVVTDLPGVKEWMGSAINNSGIIEYVKLPRLKDVDIPFPEDLREFEENLSKAIIKQIENKLTFNDELRNFINKKSWKSAFEDIEKLFI